MLVPLKKDWCVVLGASSGMGKATALALAREGMNIAGIYLESAAAQPAVDALSEEIRSFGGQAHMFNANAASERARRELVARIGELTEGRGVRILLHSLAFGSLMPFLPQADGQEAIASPQMDMTLNVMAHSLVYWTRDLVVANLLRPGAKVFAMTSGGDTKASLHYGAVSAAKCALEAHVRQLSLELAPSNIAVNALRAGVTITPALLKIPNHEELIGRALKYNPHGRLTTTDDVAEAIVTLSVSDSSWITGNVISVDGGEAVT